MLITSRNNPTVKKLLSLQEKKYRAKYGEYLVEGEKMVAECIAAKKEITLLVFSESAYNALTEKPNGGMPVIILSDDVFLKLSGEKSPQGVMASVKLPMPAMNPPKDSCLLLDGVSDPGNLGTVIRTANAAGYKEIYLLNCADPYAPKAVRASMSGIFHTELYITSDAAALFAALEGTPIVTADLNGENIFTFTPPEKFCLAIGNEGHGISKTTDEHKKYTVTIPMRSTQESLNAGVSSCADKGMPG